MIKPLGRIIVVACLISATTCLTSDGLSKCTDLTPPIAASCRDTQQMNKSFTSTQQHKLLPLIVLLPAARGTSDPHHVQFGPAKVLFKKRGSHPCVSSHPPPNPYTSQPGIRQPAASFRSTRRHDVYNNKKRCTPDRGSCSTTPRNATQNVRRLGQRRNGETRMIRGERVTSLRFKGIDIQAKEGGDHCQERDDGNVRRVTRHACHGPSRLSYVNT